MRKARMKFWGVFLVMAPVMMIGQVAPAIAAALIAGSAGLMQGLLNQKAQQEEERRRKIFEAQQGGFRGEQQAIANTAEGQVSAFDRLMKAYQGALL